MDLKKYKLGDIADFNKRTLNKSDSIKEIIYLDTSSITENVISDTVTLHVADAPSRAQRKVEHYTIIYSTVRPRLKHYGILKTPSSNLIVSTGFVTIDLKPEYKGYIDPRYLYLLLTQPSITEYIGNIADTAVSAYPSINPLDISALSFNFPEFHIQNRIADVWENYDQKIALNRAINDNLEAMAKQLYNYWFVQFDFPNEEGKPYKSSGGKMVWNEKLKREIPDGWSAKSIFDEISLQYGFPFSTDDFTEEVTNIPVVRIRDILDNTISAYSHEETDDKYRLNEADLLIGMDGNFHMNYWIDNIAYLNQRSVRLRSKQDSNVSIVQARYDIEPYIKAKEQRAKGSTVGHLSDKDLKELKVMVCPNREMRDVLDSLLYRIIANRKENLCLTKQRDELLPLLMNGQVSVNYHLFFSIKKNVITSIPIYTTFIQVRVWLKKSSSIGCLSLEFYYPCIPNVFQYERSWLRYP